MFAYLSSFLGYDSANNALKEQNARQALLESEKQKEIERLRSVYSKSIQTIIALHKEILGSSLPSISLPQPSGDNNSLSATDVQKKYQEIAPLILLFEFQKSGQLDEILDEMNRLVGEENGCNAFLEAQLERNATLNVGMEKWNTERLKSVRQTEEILKK